MNEAPPHSRQRHALFPFYKERTGAHSNKVMSRVTETDTGPKSPSDMQSPARKAECKKECLKTQLNSLLIKFLMQLDLTMPKGGGGGMSL